MKVLIVSGFLGAGKTTFIQKMVRATKRDYVIVENEFAEWSIDAAQLQANDDTRLDVWELTEGCVCCNQKGRFTDSLLTISNTLNPEYLIVEPSGVASLQAVCHSVSTVAYERICLLPPITLVDAQHFFNQNASRWSMPMWRHDRFMSLMNGPPTRTRPSDTSFILSFCPTCVIVASLSSSFRMMTSTLSWPIG